MRGLLLQIKLLLINCFDYLLEIFQIRDNTQEPCGRLSFMKEPRSYRSLAHNAICNLNITLSSYAKVINHHSLYNAWCNAWYRIKTKDTPVTSNKSNVFWMLSGFCVFITFNECMDLYNVYACASLFISSELSISQVNLW